MCMYVAYNAWGEMVADSPTIDGLFRELERLGIDESDVECFEVSG